MTVGIIKIFSDGICVVIVFPSQDSEQQQHRQVHTALNLSPANWNLAAEVASHSSTSTFHSQRPFIPTQQIIF